MHNTNLIINRPITYKLDKNSIPLIYKNEKRRN